MVIAMSDLVSQEGYVGLSFTVVKDKLSTHSRSFSNSAVVDLVRVPAVGPFTGIV